MNKNKKHNENLASFDASEFLINNKGLIIAIVVAIFIAFGIYQFYVYNKTSKAAADYDTFMLAKSNSDYKTMDIIANKGFDGASIVATFDLAQYYMSQKDDQKAQDKAAVLLNHAIKDFAQPYSNQARVYLSTLLSNQEKYDDALALLSSIKENDAFYLDASNIKAFIYAEQNKADDLAATKNAVLTNARATESQKEIAKWIQ